jgi:7-cyano-7-deazaguanine synthase
LDFARAVSQGLFYSTQVQARVESPVQMMSKDQIVREALALDLPFELVWSCYEGEDKMCGRCESCLRSKRAYQKAGAWEKTKGFFET